MSSTTQQRNQYLVDGVPHARREWTDEDVQFVKDKWGAGWSGAQIVAELPGRTRNAVLGLIDRKGFERVARHTNQHSRAVQPVARKPRAERRKAHNERPERKSAMSAQPEKRSPRNATQLNAIKNGFDPGNVERFEEPGDGVGVSFLELTNESCRWPKGTPGEPGFMFCGEATADLRADKPYCPFHMRKRRQP